MQGVISAFHWINQKSIIQIAEFVAKTKIDKILNPHQVNADEIIENVLIDYGIDDIKIIDLAKEKMTVKKIKRN